MSAEMRSLKFTVDDSLQPWNIPMQQWLLDNGKTDELQGLASAVAVFDTQGRLLLVQRAAHDSMPNKWELPGGAVDLDDPTILYGAARELSEEAGLLAKHFSHLVSAGPGAAPHIFTNRTGKVHFCRFTFHAEVEDVSKVQLDPNEHQAYHWAKKEEVEAQQTQAGLSMPITGEVMADLMLHAFRLKG